MNRSRTDCELIDAMVEVANAAENKWPRQFAHSIIKQANRKTWRPSVKQRAMMQRMVKQLTPYSEGFDLIDHDDDFNQDIYPDATAQSELTLMGHIDRASV